MRESTRERQSPIECYSREVDRITWYPPKWGEYDIRTLEITTSCSDIFHDFCLIFGMSERAQRRISVLYEELRIEKCWEREK